MPRRTKNTAIAAIETTIESHVAGRIRLRRGLLGMSQSELAKSLGITFQQVQKYERGSNRVSIGKLFRLAEILDVPLVFFFDGLEIAGSRISDETGEPGDEQSPILSRRELELLRTWRSAPQEVSDSVASLLRAVISDEPQTEAAAAVRVAVPTEGNIEDTPLNLDDLPEPRTRKARAKILVDDSNGRRRRRGAVWDPADIEKAVRGGTQRR